MLQPRLERWYRRLGPEYVPRAVFVQGQLLYPVMLGAIAGVSAYVHMSLGQYLRLALLGCAFQFGYTLVSHPTVKRLSAPIAYWLERREDPARWRCDRINHTTRSVVSPEPAQCAVGEE